MVSINGEEFRNDIKSIFYLNLIVFFMDASDRNVFLHYDNRTIFTANDD